jgi:alanine racemase
MNGNAYTARQVAEITGGKLITPGDPDLPLRELLIDSRRLIHPATTLFIALVSNRNDGHLYIGELLQKGVRNFLVSKLPPINGEEGKAASFILVPDTLAALQALGARHRSRFRCPVVGITGSNGKTIVKEWLCQLLEKDHKIARNPKSFNSQIGVPLSVWNMEEEDDLGIFEAGISEPGEMKKLESILRPTIGIFTNIGHAHDEGFRNRNRKIREKLRLFIHSEQLVYCRDHEAIHAIVRKEGSLKHLSFFTWGTRRGTDLRINRTEKTDRETILYGNFRGKRCSVTIPFTDDASVENAIHCWAVLLLLGYSPEVIAERMALLTPVEMRLEMKEGINRCLLINDFYNSDITSLDIALDFLNLQKQHEKKTVILSDILQSGLKPEVLYGQVAELLNKKSVHRLIGIGREIRNFTGLFILEKSFFDSTAEFLRSFPLTSFHDETILLKGARVFEFEQISRSLQQRVHETVLEINLDALVHNLNYYRSKLRPGTRTMVMVKAFSYGSGSHEIASLLQFHRVDWLAVAYADEGVELRKSGITLPIMIMNPEEESLDLVLGHNLEPEIYNFRILDLLEQAMGRNHRDRTEPVRIHIKLDTGMHRLGFDREDLELLIRRLKANASIEVASIFSHLAASEDPSEDPFTLRQITELREMCGILAGGIGPAFLSHILNSAGITRFPEAQMDMVRLGIGLYGVGFNEEEQSRLKNVSTLKTTISQIKKIKAGETIGYNRKGIAGEDKTIAIVPIGYADGLNRRLGNGNGNVFIRGKPAPFIGNISMDTAGIDLTRIPREPGDPEIREGDEVIVFGDGYPISKLAEALGTIPYEILTGISRRVKRIYFHE